MRLVGVRERALLVVRIETGRRVVGRLIGAITVGGLRPAELPAYISRVAWSIGGAIARVGVLLGIIIVCVVVVPTIESARQAWRPPCVVWEFRWHRGQCL